MILRQIPKEVKVAKENLKSTKQAYKSKKVSRKAKTFLYVLGREGGELASENEDLEGYRTLQETIRKGKRYSRLSYNLGKASVKTGQATGRFTKKRLTNTKERYHHFKDGKGWKLAKENTYYMRTDAVSLLSSDLETSPQEVEMEIEL